MTTLQPITTARPGCFAVGGLPAFSVTPGLPTTDALELASCFLDAVNGLTASLSDDGGRTAEAFAAQYLAELAKALVDSATDGLLKRATHS